MCDFPLVAWLDGELEGGEAEEIRAHIEGCAKCREQVRRIRSVSATITEYSAERARLRRSRTMWWIAGTAAAAVIVAALLWTPRAPKTVPVAAVRPAAVVEKPRAAVITPAPVRKVRLHATRPVQQPAGVRVVVSLESLLPVGAAPPGAVLVGELILDAAGQPAAIRLE